MRVIQCPKSFKNEKPRIFDEAGKEVEYTFTNFLRNAVNGHRAFGSWPESRKGNKLVDLFDDFEKQIVQDVLMIENDLWEALQNAVKAYGPTSGVQPVVVMAFDRHGFYDAVMEAKEEKK